MNDTKPNPLVNDIARLRRVISHNADGPVTDFVLIARACRCPAEGEDPEAVANALWEELESRGAKLTTA